MIFSKFRKKQQKEVPHVSQPKTEVQDQFVELFIRPAQFNLLTHRSRLSPHRWYHALWILSREPETTPHELAQQLDVSWATARSMRQKIEHARAHH